MKYLDLKIVRSRKSRLGHMGKRKMPNTVSLQLSFDTNGFFLKMYMWCCEMFFWRKVMIVFRCCGDSSLCDNVFDEFLRILSMPFSLKSLIR